MNSANAWTGQSACALQEALRLSNEAFAERLGIGVRTVAGWHQKPTIRPQSEMQQLLDTALEQAPPAAKARFAAANAPGSDQDTSQKAADAEHRLTADPNISAALHWLDQAAGWEQGTARRTVAVRLAQVDLRQLHDRGVRRGRVDQARVAETLSAYYSHRTEPHGLYAAAYGQDGRAATSILTRPDWLDLGCPLMPATDRLRVTNNSTPLSTTGVSTALNSDHAVTDRPEPSDDAPPAHITKMVDMQHSIGPGWTLVQYTGDAEASIWRVHHDGQPVGTVRRDYDLTTNTRGWEARTSRYIQVPATLSFAVSRRNDRLWRTRNSAAAGIARHSGQSAAHQTTIAARVSNLDAPFVRPQDTSTFALLM
jgi:hypothetical protein